ncbi:WD repeat and coiled-coil-containing protein [Erinaceus europaeus]|uniref:WD repeat and coiled-coil-containing protein n=1 Tax=Erinaceus europaeus TaxID=9365 RepID=A0A1S2ZBI9_ERIEU|nr:WD repeat and coiled-coil-containing protein [Erinaceus europaeus]XP_060042630.1 WD repeat and coiled-coil-containing protein [Erinaceus europaeus]
MDLGKGKLLRTGLNALYQAIHPVHGLAWTNGNQVLLTQLQLLSGEASFGDSKVIGQFEQVYGVSWAPAGLVDSPALLAVQHKKRVTVWQLVPCTSEKSEQPMSQTCEIKESLPILPQGCVWHPQNALLTVLTAEDVSVYYHVHRGHSQARADVEGRGPIHCACWTQDGQRLVVAVGSSLHSYIWDGPQKTLQRCSFYPVFDVDSCVRSITATVASQVAVTTELPLDKICGLSASGALAVQPSGEDTCPYTSSSVMDKVATDSETPFSDLLDLTHIRFKKPEAEGRPLFCLRETDPSLTGTGLDSSHLVLVTFEKGVNRTSKVTIPGILVPDLIAFNPPAQVVAVASNTCNIIFIYSIVPSFMPNIQQVELESSERPKGLCFLTSKLLLILVGKQTLTDSTFLPASKSNPYLIRLVVRPVMLEEFSLTLRETQSGCLNSNTRLNQVERKKRIGCVSPDCWPQRGALLLTPNSNSQGGRPGSPLIKEIRHPPSGLSNGSSFGPLETLEMEPVNWAATLPRSSTTSDPTSTPQPPSAPQIKHLTREKETSQLSKELEMLSRKLTDMQQSLSELTDLLRNEKKPSPVYPLCEDLPCVHITYQKPYVGPAVEKRTVLLCSGKLRLSAIQQTFGLCLIEMLHGSHWVLLSADSEGFIPLTFTASQEITIRNGSL